MVGMGVVCNQKHTLVSGTPCWLATDILSGPISMSRSSLISAAARLRRLGPHKSRACKQLAQLQSGSGKPLVEEVPK